MRARDQEIQEAVMRERARCLWCLDQIMVELRADLQRKLLIEGQRHLIQTKVKIAGAIVLKARRAIVAGAKPKSQEQANGRHDNHDAVGGGEEPPESVPPATSPEG